MSGYFRAHCGVWLCSGMHTAESDYAVGYTPRSLTPRWDAHHGARLHSRVGHQFFSKERNVSAFFSVLYKRTLRSLLSFTFFSKERCILCALFRPLEKNGKEQNVLLGSISRQKLKKEWKRRLLSLKERKRTEHSERKRTRCPTLLHGRMHTTESSSVVCITPQS